MEWLRYEWQCVKRGALDAWRSRRPTDLMLDGLIVVAVASALTVTSEIPVWESVTGAAITGAWALGIGVFLIFLLNFMLAPFRIHKEMQSGHERELRILNANVRNLEQNVRIYTQSEEDAEKLDIAAALELLPEQGRLQLFHEGAFRRRFAVFGVNMDGEPGSEHLLYFETGTRQLKAIASGYWEDHVLRYPHEEIRDVAVMNGEAQYYTDADRPKYTYRYTHLSVAKEQFEEYAKNCRKQASQGEEKDD